MKWVILIAIIGMGVSWWVTSITPHPTKDQQDAWWSAHGLTKN